ncbi:type I 3-dehydroquinate dehydratase [Chloroflexota bacterium]
MKKTRICATIINNDPQAAREVNNLVDLFEVRIDLIGEDWAALTRQLKKPWIACNRIAEEGGKWQGNEARRIEKLLQAAELGAEIIDIELGTKNLDRIVPIIKKRVKCLLSFHDFEKTPSLNQMKEVVEKQQKAGADICKIVTTAQTFEDNLTTLKLISDLPAVRVISFAMGPLGVVSRILSPLVGSDFTYASIELGKESAEGQLTVRELAQIYGMVGE